MLIFNRVIDTVLLSVYFVVLLLCLKLYLFPVCSFCLALRDIDINVFYQTGFAIIVIIMLLIFLMIG